MHRKSFLAAQIPALNKVFEHHTVLHHMQYREVFNDEPVGVGKDRGIRLSVKEGFLEAIPVGALISLVSWQGGVIFILVVCIHHYLWGKIHLEMHKPEARWFSRWPVYQFLARHHYLHHRYPTKNFNVVIPIADYILGTRAHPSASDFQHMEEIGISCRKRHERPRIAPRV